MKVSLKPLAPNMNEVQLGPRSLLFSYETLVAVKHEDGFCYRISPSPSKTTSKHLNKWCPKDAFELRSEDLQTIAEA